MDLKWPAAKSISLLAFVGITRQHLITEALPVNRVRRSTHYRKICEGVTADSHAMNLNRFIETFIEGVALSQQ
jgi:hypothetical protein